MYITAIPNRASPPAVLLRETYREDGKVKNRTLANLSKLPPTAIEALRASLKGGTVVERLEDAFDVVRSRPHGHVAAVLGTVRKLGVDRLISSQPSRQRDLCVAMIVEQILNPRSKLATARGLDPETLTSSLGEVLGISGADEDELYEAMDWILELQPSIESVLAKRHLQEGCFALWDLTSVRIEGRHCPLAKIGYSREGVKNSLQIEFGLLTDEDGRPVAVEVFPGNMGDPKTFSAQVSTFRSRFGIEQVVFVGDRGMITEARIKEDLKPGHFDWITALRSSAIQDLMRRGSIQPSLFEEYNLAEISDPEYPDERLVVCRNPLLGEERARKREELLQATEKILAKIAAATQRAKRPLRGKDKIGLRAGRVLGRFKMEKHFRFTIEDQLFTYERDQASISTEAALDGIYVVRTSVSKDRLGAEQAVSTYKRLARVERAFRCLKTIDLAVRPVRHRLESRVRAHVLLCMLAYYVEWHMRKALAPILFEDDQPKLGEARRPSAVAPAQRSPAAEKKSRTKRTAENQPVHSFRTLLNDLATIVKDRMQPKAAPGAFFEKITVPTSYQQRALDLLGVSHRL